MSKCAECRGEAVYLTNTQPSVCFKHPFEHDAEGTKHNVGLIDNYGVHPQPWVPKRYEIDYEDS